MSKCFVVLGMHRSATSLTAKGLHEAGVYMGRLNHGTGWLGKTKDQPHGHFECQDFVALNRWILKEVGGSWMNPPPFEKILRIRGIDNVIQEIITKHKRPLWGWKDPRTILTYDLYAPHLEDVHLVCNFRDPAAVAKSIERRDNMNSTKALKLAKVYHKRLMTILERYG